MLNPAKAAISVGTLFGVWHLMWVTLVAVGVAKPLMDLVLKLHFIKLDYTLAPFVFSTAITLVGLTFAIGAVLGLVFALIWNWLSGSERSSGRPALNSR
jgi:fatty acid desaturase